MKIENQKITKEQTNKGAKKTNTHIRLKNLSSNKNALRKTSWTPLTDRIAQSVRLTPRPQGLPISDTREKRNRGVAKQTTTMLHLYALAIFSSMQSLRIAGQQRFRVVTSHVATSAPRVC